MGRLRVFSFGLTRLAGLGLVVGDGCDGGIVIVIFSIAVAVVVLLSSF